jgi:hypothetical protein
MKFTEHKITHAKVNSSMAFSTLQLLCGHHIYFLQFFWELYCLSHAFSPFGCGYFADRNGPNYHPLIYASCGSKDDWCTPLGSPVS